jgi:hypothetical protein
MGMAGRCATCSIIDDLLDAYDAAVERIDVAAGTGL